MSIKFENGNFKLDTKNTTYSFKVADYGYIMHTYYGGFISDIDLNYVYPYTERSYVASPYEDKNLLFRLNDVPTEYSTYGISDFRTTAVRVKHSDGSRALDLRYFSHNISDGVILPEGLPAATLNGGKNVSTLTLTLKDTASETYIDIYYTVFEDSDVITRFEKISNKGENSIFVEKMASLQLDLHDDGYDYISLFGAWAKERHAVRTPLTKGTQGFVSRRGTSSHQHNPFVALVRKNTDEKSGEAYGFHLVYSGNHRTEIETTQFDTARLLMGINDEGFSYEVKQNESFTCPEAIMTFSEKGLGGMSRNMHNFINNHIIRPNWKNVRRPILINNWEATYFDFTEDKLVSLAETAGELGIELLVMDDGWFGHREDDKTSLGDWVPYKKRLAGGLEPLARRINEKGVRFGLWMEPEMISEDSDLYRNHPDWVLCIPNRSRTLGRNQFVLDLINDEVREYITDVIIGVLSSADISYLKWDMNRYLTEVYSATLGKENQGEAYHRYVLSLYKILNDVITRFPNLLIEHCSGGGGRFDTGMLYYSPQIWTSDDTDAAERVEIQLGTSIAYPVSSMGSHVSAVPNHQTGRTTSFETRGNIAFNGTFGYELDITSLKDEEKKLIKEQCEFYKKHYFLINNGDFYRLEHIKGERSAWCYVSKDKKEVLFFFVQLEAGANDPDILIKLDGLDKKMVYTDADNGRSYFGDTLMNLGISIPFEFGERRSVVKYFKA